MDDKHRINRRIFRDNIANILGHECNIRDFAITENINIITRAKEAFLNKKQLILTDTCYEGEIKSLEGLKEFFWGEISGKSASDREKLKIITKEIERI